MNDPESVISQRSRDSGEPSWLVGRRKAALTLFKEKPMPSFVYGLNINLDISIDLAQLPLDKAENTMHTITGKSGAIISDLKNALAGNETLLREKFMTQCVPAHDKFTALHQALVGNVLLVHIPKNAVIEKPIEIGASIRGPVSFDHLLIVAEENAHATIIESVHGGTNAYASRIVEILAGKNAQVSYGNVQLLDSSAFQFTRKRAVALDNARVNWLDCCFGSNITLSEVSTYLDGEGAETNNYGIFFGNKQQQFDLVANSIHNAPNTRSDIFTKGALTDQAKCIYRGLVKIGRKAAGSNGYQKEDTLLLSPKAAADSIPDLEIDNSDVRCTHGASIGRIDREKLFYLRSRGLNEQEATREYVKGFFEPLIQKMHIRHLQDEMHDFIEQRMH